MATALVREADQAALRVVVEADPVPGPLEVSLSRPSASSRQRSPDELVTT